jgi:HEAT repeat protein
MVRRTLPVWLCLAALAVGCHREPPRAPKKEAGQKREQVYTDKTPEQWLQLIQHRSPQVREKAVDALVQYGKGQVPALTVIVENKAAGPGRLAACRALGEIGPGAKAAAPALAQALRDSAWNDRDAAAEALGRIRPDVDASAPALVAALRDTDQRVRGVAARALGRLRSGDAKIVAALAAALKDEDANVRASAAMGLQEIGPPAKAAIPDLEKAAATPDFISAQAAAEALKTIRGQ